MNQMTRLEPSVLALLPERRIFVGTHKSVNALREALRDFSLDFWADAMLSNRAFSLSQLEREVTLVPVLSQQLGFKLSVTRREIYARAQSIGLDLCTPDIGPLLRLQYLDQPRGDWLWIGMVPIISEYNASVIFGVGHSTIDGEGLSLSAYSGDADHKWAPESSWIFAKPGG